MNLKYILSHLEEAEEELRNTVRTIHRDLKYDEGEFYVAMQHIYNHLNSAWNSRNALPKQIVEESYEDFRKWRQYPEDIDMSA